MIPQASKQILLVTRDKEMAKFVGQCLRPYNYRVDAVFSGVEALDFLKQYIPDLILLEDILPDMPAVEICRAIKSNEKWSDLRIIFLMGHGISTEDLRVLSRYGEDHIMKPFDYRELLVRVEVALCRGSYAQYSQGSQDMIIKELKGIVKNKLITPFFQPIYALPAFKLIGVEALSRPFTETFLSNPELFFKAALTFGMYNEAENLAWQKAFAVWEKKIGRGKLFLNCTPYYVDYCSADKMFFSNLNVLPEHVVIELTERMAICDYKALLAKLASIRSLGVQVAVDDVGSGFAGLDTVVEVRPEYLKIDLSLTRNVHLDPLRKNIIRSIVGFCHESGIKTIAEGIESLEELQVIRQLNVDAVQGYFLGKPSPEVPEALPFKESDL